MDYNEILDFLKENQPFPDDENIKEYEIDMYADAVKYLDEVYSDEKCIPLLLKRIDLNFDGTLHDKHK